jgi:hypothetical protein
MSCIIIYNESENNINPCFIRANGFLLKKYEHLFSVQSIEENKNILRKLWISEFNAKLLTCNNTWTEIVFDTDYDKMIFLLRWG